MQRKSGDRAATFLALLFLSRVASISEDTPSSITRQAMFPTLEMRQDCVSGLLTDPQPRRAAEQTQEQQCLLF